MEVKKVKKVKAKDLRYLAFEGGGGKGVTYLGAIRELEDRIRKIEGRAETAPIIKITTDRTIVNRIKGISGASAGAITALLLCMGWKSGDIEKELSNSAKFEAFFDDAAGKQFMSRSVRGDIRKWIQELREVNPRSKMLDNLLYGKSFMDLKAISVSGMNLLLSIFLRGKESPAAKRIGTNPYRYLNSLLFERGLFPGFAVRNYFKDHINQFLIEIINAGYRPKSERAKRTIGRSGLSYATFTFAVLEDISKVKLAVTGTNITTRRPEYFSSDYTPDFPVGEAVGISMNLPFLFKPVTVNYDVRGDRIGKERYAGRWVDGGLLNNLPIHYFDDLKAFQNTRYQLPEPDYSMPLNKTILALRLTDGFKPGEKDNDPPPPIAILDTFEEHLGDIAGTTLYPSENGQIRTAQEKAQTIDLYTYKLETTDFAPKQAKKERPIREAQRSVKEYFDEAEKE